MKKLLVLVVAFALVAPYASAATFSPESPKTDLHLEGILLPMSIPGPAGFLADVVQEVVVWAASGITGVQNIVDCDGDDGGDDRGGWTAPG